MWEPCSPTLRGAGFAPGSSGVFSLSPRRLDISATPRPGADPHARAAGRVRGLSVLVPPCPLLSLRSSHWSQGRRSGEPAAAASHPRAGGAPGAPVPPGPPHLRPSGRQPLQRGGARPSGPPKRCLSRFIVSSPRCCSSVSADPGSCSAGAAPGVLDSGVVTRAPCSGAVPRPARSLPRGWRGDGARVLHELWGVRAQRPPRCPLKGSVTH